jgi:hypothetical protein
MWSRMRNGSAKAWAAAILAVAWALVPASASAGVITSLKTSVRTTDSAEAQKSQLLLPLFAMASESPSSGGGASTDESGSARPPKKPGSGPRHPGDPVMLYGASEWAQIEQGLITEEEAISGCGGAQVAGGNAGWGALALVGLFLALRRRR